MTGKERVEAVTHYVYAAVEQVFTADDVRAVRLDSGGVIITANDGGHVHVVVQQVHFEPGEELPF